MQEVRKAWTRHYPGETYIKLLHTFSDYRSMQSTTNTRFFTAIAGGIAQMGGEVIRDYETLVLLAKKG